tara:strand:- start:372 stop:728 length:357 start_codon:yes stop_codon:yes gene_type:complete
MKITRRQLRHLIREQIEQSLPGTAFEDLQFTGEDMLLPVNADHFGTQTIRNPDHLEMWKQRFADSPGFIPGIRLAVTNPDYPTNWKSVYPPEAVEKREGFGAAMSRYYDGPPGKYYGD